MSQAAIELKGIACTFVSDDSGMMSTYTAVKNVDLTVADGEFVSVVGPTGCGKSTLLNMSAGLLEPSAGTVSIFGEPLVGLNRRAGYMFQADSLMPWKSALDNVAAGLLLRKRVAMAQTLIKDPDIILMDESFSALDIQTRQLMENELLNLWQAKRKAVLFITHDLDEAISMSDRVVVMSAGPESHPIGEFSIDLPRPRDVSEVRVTPRFIELHTAIWSVLREEVLKGYAQQQRKVQQ